MKIKSILKEICIMLLLCVAIVLVLGVIFYDYIPANKAVPNKLQAYSTPQNIKEEIDQQITETNFNTEEILTYDITGADLSVFEEEESYIAGKPDPFSASTNIDENGSKNQIKDPNSTGTYFENNGLK